MTHRFVKFILCFLCLLCILNTQGLTSVIKQKLKDNDITQLKKNADTLWDIQKYLKNLWLLDPRLEKSRIYSVIAMNLQSSALFMGQSASPLMWYALTDQSPGLFGAYGMSSWTNKGTYCNVKKEEGGEEEDEEKKKEKRLPWILVSADVWRGGILRLWRFFKLIWHYDMAMCIQEPWAECYGFSVNLSNTCFLAGGGGVFEVCRQ